MTFPTLSAHISILRVVWCVVYFHTYFAVHNTKIPMWCTKYTNKYKAFSQRNWKTILKLTIKMVYWKLDILWLLVESHWHEWNSIWIPRKFQKTNILSYSILFEFAFIFWLNQPKKFFQVILVKRIFNIFKQFG